MTRSTRNWLIVLVLVPAAAYGVAKLAVWYSVKDALDNVRATLSPVASLEHTKILSPVFGPFGVTGLHVQPHIVDNGISIGSALVNIPDPIEKYGFLRATMNDTLPTSFNLSLNRVRVPLDGGIAEWLDRNAASPDSGSGPPGACNTGAPFTVRDLKQMGYEELVADIIVDYAYDRRSGGLVTYANIRLRDMVEITLEGKIPPGEVVFAIDRLQAAPRLSDLSITVDDDSWASRFNDYCAAAMGLTQTQYVQDKVTEMREMLVATGFEPSDELMAALEKFTTGKASLTLSLNPRDPLDPTQLPATGGDPEIVIDRLGIEVLVDGRPVQDLGAARQQAPEDEEEGEQWVDETYKPTPVRELALYLQSQVKITTDDGKVHEGYLDSVGAGAVVITRHLRGGSVTFDVPREDIEEVLVLRP